MRNLLNMAKGALLASMLFAGVDSANAYDPNRIPRPLPLGQSDPLPDGWKFKDIGNITPPSDFCYVAEQRLYYIKAYGNEVTGFTSGDDQFAFVYFETDEDKQVSVRIMDAEIVADTPAKGFIMLRGDLENNAAHSMVEVFEGGGNSVVLCWRPYKGLPGEVYFYKSGTNGSTKNPPNCFPRWIKFVRQGLYVQGFHKDDVEGAQWVKLSTVRKLELKGKVYMGIGASAILNVGYGGDRTKPGIFLFDNLDVEEIEVPYAVNNPESVSNAFLEPLKPERVKDIDVTEVFGHALGEYFTIDVRSTDPSIADAYFWERKVVNPNDGENFRKFIRITGKSEGVTSIRLTCTINGYTMDADYAINISDGKAKPKTARANAPYGWELLNLQVPVNPELIWGEEFITKRLTVQKKFPVFIGAWEYDWSVEGTDGNPTGGNYGYTPGNQAPIQGTLGYVAGAKLYNFRDLDFKYSRENGFPKDITRKEISGASSIDLACIIANDTAKEVTKTDFFSIDKGSDGSYYWRSSAGFWTELHNMYTTNSLGESVKTRGYPYITNVQPGDWVAYTVYAPRAGYYNLYAMTASKEDNKSLQIMINGVVQVKELKLTKGANSSDWKKSATEAVLLNEGRNQIRVGFNGADINFLGLKSTFKNASKAPYSGINFDDNKYVAQEQVYNFDLFSEEEKDFYDKNSQGLIDSTKEYIDSVLLTLPTKHVINESKVIDNYRTRVGGIVGTRQDTLDYIYNNLTTSFDSLTFVTTQQSQFKHIDVTSYLFKRNIDPHKAIEITMRIDSIANSGKGTYAGIMFRSLFDDGITKNIASNSPFASFSIGSYEGGRLGYRWNYNSDLRKFDDESIAQKCYIRVRLNEFAPGYLTAYYSYDNLFWWEFLKDPLKVDFFESSNVENIVAGIFLTGGNFANDATLAFSCVSDVDIRTFDSKDDFENLSSIKEMKNLPLRMSSTKITQGDNVDVFFNVPKPGLVSLNVYDSFGVCVESILDYKFMDFSKDGLTISHTFKNITQTGVYLLRLEGPNNEQYIRFQFVK